VCWGDGASGQLGIAPPDAGAPRPPPQTIAGVADAKRVAAGLSGFACAVTSAGQILCWGANDKGQLGRGSAGGFDRRPGPVKL
jgi:alpha-tubulin suppressor-like RCC1 family protein